MVPFRRDADALDVDRLPQDPKEKEDGTKDLASPPTFEPVQLVPFKAAAVDRASAPKQAPQKVRAGRDPKR